ncbi:unnamed protein product, partial [Prorocentrum cordatum]
MIAGTATSSAIAALCLAAGVLLRPANWLGDGCCSGGLVGVIWTSSATSATETSVTWTKVVVDAPISCPPPVPLECPRDGPESSHVLGEGVTGSTVEIPSWLLLLALGGGEAGIAWGAWRCCARRASDLRRRQPLGEARLQAFLVADGGHWASFVYTPDGDFYVEQETDYSNSALLAGRKGYPAGFPQVVAFSRALEPDEVSELVKRARAEAVAMTGSEGPDPSVPDAVNWRGGRLDLPAYSPVQAPRLSASGRRLRGKQAMPLPVGDVEGSGAALVPASEPGGGAPTPLPEAADGHGWLRSDLACWDGAFAFGTELRPGQPPCVGLRGRGEYGIATDGSGGHHPVELVELGRVAEWREAKLLGASRLRGGGEPLEKRLLDDGPLRPPALAPSTARAEAAEVDDLRACWIDCDDAGVRYKEWKKVLQAATQESVQTAGLRGPPACLPVCRKFHKHGGTPKAWFAEWAREVGISRQDRAWHEVECLIECLWLAGSYDQLNVGAAAALEVVARRLLQCVEACAKGADNPNWSAAKHFSATSSALDLAPEEMRMCAARQAKDELELESLRMSASTEKKILGLQADVRQRVVEAASRWCDVDSAVGERGASARLLKGRSGSAPAPSCSAGSYEYSKVSMPSDLHDSPSLISMLPSEARGHLEDFEKLMLRPAQESELIQQYEGVPGCHADPALQGDPRTYGRLVRRVARVGMATFTRDPACVLGVFFVAKKADELRLIVDCRRANQLFQKPPGVALLSGEGLSRVEIDDPEGLLEGLPAHLGAGDVADCFHRMRLVKTAGGDIPRYFCWPPLAPKHAGVSEVDGVAVRLDEKIWPMCASRPMGFSWSSHFAQTANDQRLGHQPALRQSQELSDRGPSAGHPPRQGQAQRDFDADALRFHEMEVFDHGGPSLGWHLSGDARVARPSDKRFALVRRGVRALLRLRKVSGWQVEAALGHVAFLCLMRRELLSIFHTHAFEVAGVKVDPGGGDVERDFLGRPARLDREARGVLEAARRGRNEDFAEVPSRLLAGDRWRLFSLAFARNVRLYFRWIPGEFNSGGEGGRIYDTWHDAEKTVVSHLGTELPRAEPEPEGQATRVRTLTLERGLASRLTMRSRALEQGRPERRVGSARAQTTEAFLGQVADEIPDRLARAPGPAVRGAPADIEGEDGSESDDSSDPEERAATAARQRALRRRGKNRARQCLSALIGAALLGARLTPLEARSVTEAAAAQRRQRVLAFLSWGPFSEAVLEEPARPGVALTDFTNREFEQGHRPLTVGMRVPIVVEIARLGVLMAAVLTLIMAEGYLRPGEMLGPTPASFLPPAPGGVATRALQLFPQEGNLRSKTGESDDSIPLGSRRFGWMDAIYQVLSRRPQGSERLLDWSFREYVSVFRRAAANLNWAVVPYRGRHTGASADRAENLRTQEQVMERGRWQTLRSVRRCEKAGRVNQAWRELDAEDQDHVWLCMRMIEGIFLRGDAAATPPYLRRGAEPDPKRVRCFSQCQRGSLVAHRHRDGMGCAQRREAAANWLCRSRAHPVSGAKWWNGAAMQQRGKCGQAERMQKLLQSLQAEAEVKQFRAAQRGGGASPPAPAAGDAGSMQVDDDGAELSDGDRRARIKVLDKQIEQAVATAKLAPWAIWTRAIEEMRAAREKHASLLLAAKPRMERAVEAQAAHIAKLTAERDAEEAALVSQRRAIVALQAELEHLVVSAGGAPKEPELAQQMPRLGVSVEMLGAILSGLGLELQQTQQVAPQPAAKTEQELGAALAAQPAAPGGGPAAGPAAAASAEAAVAPGQAPIEEGPPPGDAASAAAKPRVEGTASEMLNEFLLRSFPVDSDVPEDMAEKRAPMTSEEVRSGGAVQLRAVGRSSPRSSLLCSHGGLAYFECASDRSQASAPAKGYFAAANGDNFGPLKAYLQLLDEGCKAVAAQGIASRSRRSPELNAIFETSALVTYVSHVIAEGLDWIAVGDWNMAPEVLGPRVPGPAQGFLAAPSAPTCAKCLPGSALDDAACSRNLLPRRLPPQVGEASPLPVHAAVRFPILSGRPSAVDACAARASWLPHQARLARLPLTDRWQRTDSMILAACEDCDLQCCWDEVLRGLGAELLNRADVMDVSARRRHEGRAGVPETAWVRLRWEPPHLRIRLPPRVHAWASLARWAKHVLRSRVHLSRLVRLYAKDPGPRVLGTAKNFAVFCRFFERIANAHHVWEHATIQVRELFAKGIMLLVEPDLEVLMSQIVTIYGDHLAIHARVTSERWRAWVNAAFQNGAGGAHRATKVQDRLEPMSSFGQDESMRGHMFEQIRRWMSGSRSGPVAMFGDFFCLGTPTRAHALKAAFVSFVEDVGPLGMAIKLDMSGWLGTTRSAARGFARAGRALRLPHRKGVRNLGHDTHGRGAGRTVAKRRLAKLGTRQPRVLALRLAAGDRIRALWRTGLLPSAGHGSAVAGATDEQLKALRHSAVALCSGKGGGNSGSSTIFLATQRALAASWQRSAPTCHGARGPLAAAWLSLRRIGWDMSSDLHLRTDVGEVLHILAVPPKVIGHMLKGAQPCTRGHQFHECPNILATGSHEDSMGIEPISEQAPKVRTRLMERIHIRAGDADYDRFDVITGIPQVFFDVLGAERLQDCYWWGDWASDVGDRSTIVYHGGSGYEAAWPEHARCGWACAHVSFEGPPIRAVFGPLPGSRQTVGRAEHRALLTATTHMPYLRFVVTDLAALAREVEAWGFHQAASGSEYADIWRDICDLKGVRAGCGRVRPAACWCPARLDLEKFAQLGNIAGDFFGNQWADFFAKVGERLHGLPSTLLDLYKVKLSGAREEAKALSWLMAAVGEHTGAARMLAPPVSALRRGPDLCSWSSLGTAWSASEAPCGAGGDPLVEDVGSDRGFPLGI